MRSRNTNKSDNVSLFLCRTISLLTFFVELIELRKKWQEDVEKVEKLKKERRAFLYCCAAAAAAMLAFSLFKVTSRALIGCVPC